MQIIKFLFVLLFFSSVLNADVSETDNFNATLEDWSGTGVSRESNKMRIEQDRTASKTYNFGASYINSSVTITFSLELAGGWESSGGSQDYFYVKVAGATVATYSHVNGTYSKTITTTTDGSGNLALSFQTDTSAAAEIAYLDNIVIDVVSGGGCDSSLDSSDAADSAPGTIITTMHNITADTLACIRGSSPNGDSDYYYFTVGVNGTLNITASSPNAHDYHLKVGSSSGGSQYYPDTTAQNHTVPQITLSAGNSVYIYVKETGSDTDEYQLDFNFTTVEGADLSLSEYVVPSPIFADIDEDINISVRANNLGTLDAQPNITLSVTYNQDVNITSASQVGGSDFSCSPSSGSLAAGSPIVCTMSSLLMSGAANKDFSFVVRATTLGELFQTSLISSATTDTNSFNSTLVSTHIPIISKGYCQEHLLPVGFRLIDPDGGDEKNSFEIFCYEDAYGILHDLIALPIKNDSNNFLFNSNATSSNYYDATANPRTHFHAIEINAKNITYSGTLDSGAPKPLIPVVVSTNVTPFSIITDGNSYKVMGSGFSNINLTGTPFVIDWDNTGALNGCNESKLRKALGQAVKYNTLNVSTTSNDGLSRCEINTMMLSLLDDYRYLAYGGSEVLQHSCKEMASYVPINILNDASVDGHFNILTTEPSYNNETPTTNGVRYNATDIGEALRPITVYCKYQADLAYVWTFLTALDAKVTQYKTDLVNKSDTCSQLGLYFYVPNNKVTFNRVREYLLNHKSGDNGWENYTGTVEEKIQALHSGNVYYLTEFKDVKIWPYGPFGVYLPSPKSKNSSLRAPMHNITSMLNYNDSMGKNGWVSILGDADLNKTNEWWIADIGAGLEITKSAGNHTYSPSGVHPTRTNTYDEPNGNYTYDAWLNFLYDESGWVYHNDDWDANYPYYDYMCMSETNYDAASRYTLVPGFFNVIERSKNTAPSFADENLSTQIVSKPIQLDLILYKLDPDTLAYDKTQLETDYNKSVGVFLSYVEDADDTVVPFKYIGTYSNFDVNNGRIQLPDITITSAKKRVLAKFYFCNAEDADWTTCWNYNNQPDTPTVTEVPASGANKSDSADDFALRPNSFHIVSASGINTVKAEDVNLLYYANNYLAQPTHDYNEAFTTLSVTTTLADASKIATCQSNALILNLPDQFINGVEDDNTTFNDVGVYNIILSEMNGTEFALVDLDDTADIDRFITPTDINLTVVPNHFTVTPLTQINVDENFTYLSNDLDNMALIFDFNVTAKNSSNAVTPNYADGCYAHNISVELQGTVSGGVAPTMIFYKELNSGTEGNSTMVLDTFVVPQGETMPSSLFTNEHNGTAELSLRINFPRDVNVSRNPFVAHFNDLNVSDQNGSIQPYNENDHVIDINGTMLYGRTHAPRHRFIGANGTVSLYYEVFCSGGGCNKALLPNGSTSLNTDDPRWFINTQHNAINDGVVGTVVQKGGTGIVTAGTPTMLNPSKTDLHYTASSTRGYPYKTTMENNASSWLIYNKHNANDTTNEFEVEFESSGNWAGKHETNTTTDSNGTSKTNRRTMW